MKLHLLLPGNIKSKKNSKTIIMTGDSPRIVPSKAYYKWEREARKTAYYQWRRAPILDQVEVTALIYYKGRKPDLSGALESIGDCLQGIIWEDDGQITSWNGSRLIHDKNNPRTELIIKTKRDNMEGQNERK